MSGVNRVFLVGNLGHSPKMKYIDDGTAIANFSIATSDEWKDKQTGEKKSKVEWHRIVAFKRLAEICGEYLKKGSQVYIEGKLQTRSWEDKEGNKRFTTEIVASQMQMLGGRDQGESGYHPPVREPVKPPEPEQKSLADDVLGQMGATEQKEEAPF